MARNRDRRKRPRQAEERVPLSPVIKKKKREPQIAEKRREVKEELDVQEAEEVDTTPQNSEVEEKESDSDGEKGRESEEDLSTAVIEDHHNSSDGDEEDESDTNDRKAQESEQGKGDSDNDEENESEGGDDDADEDKEEGGAGGESPKNNAGQSSVPATTSSGVFFSDRKFEDLQICDKIKVALDESGFKNMTEIQAQSIPLLLSGKDVLGAAATGSGKTLAFLIPAFHLLYETKFLPERGTGVLIIAPTRELVLQIADVASDVCKRLPQTHGVVMGGSSRQQEVERLKKGVCLLVATPGRLLDHMRSTKGFVFRNLLMLVIDEADRILDQGFEDEMNAIIRELPRKRQSALFSATQTSKVEDLVRLSLRNPTLISVKSQFATVEGLMQGYVICAAAQRFQLLYTFLRRFQKKKVMVFFSTCSSAKYHSDVLDFVDVKNLCIHGKQKQKKRMSAFYDFSKAESGILLCTDVAARGLDIPAVDWIVQYDPPDDPREYIHRVGRTARGAGGTGKALLFLLPEEVEFLQYLKAAKVPLNEYQFPAKKIANIAAEYQRLVGKNYHLYRGARDAYRSYMHAYASHSLRNIFDVNSLDVQHIAQAFGLETPPRVDLNLRAKSARKKQQRVQGASGKFRASGHTFSAANPYGKRSKSDRRQFVK